jgi:hypothetical protein
MNLGLWERFLLQSRSYRDQNQSWLFVNSRCAHYTWMPLVRTRGLVAPVYTGAASQANTTCLFGTTLVCLYFHVHDALKSSLCHHNLSLMMMVSGIF